MHTPIYAIYAKTDGGACNHTLPHKPKHGNQNGPPMFTYRGNAPYIIKQVDTDHTRTDILVYF